MPELMSRPNFAANAIYLMQHNLLAGPMFAEGDELHYQFFSITVEGVDFMQDDGGISAIKRTTTVKLHAETLRALLLQQVDKCAANDDEKSIIKKAIESAPEEVVRGTIGKLLDAAIDNAPAAMALLSALISAGP